MRYNVLGYLDLMATSYAASLGGYFILDNIITTDSNTFQATVIDPYSNYYLTIYYNDGIFTADRVDMSDIFILDSYMFIELAGDTPLTSIELIESYKQILERAIESNKIIGISNLVLDYLVQSIDTSNVNTRGIAPTGFSIINISQSYYDTLIGHVYYSLKKILLRIACVDGVITIKKETMLLGSGDGTKFLSNDGTYKEVGVSSNSGTVT